MATGNEGRGLIAIMGSGELTKSMLPVHRRLLERVRQSGPVKGVILDTPAAFQSNVDQLRKQAEGFFSTSLRVEFTSLAWDDYEEPKSRDAYLAGLQNANFIFCGPGSPSYAMRRWSGTEVPGILRQRFRSGACIAFASAAALTLGAATVPVYEIFKAGEEPYWLEGMDLLSELGLKVAVIPHFNNRSGDGFDTRFCYLGERRFHRMLELLPEGSSVLGIDEHTACLLDGLNRSLSAQGRGKVTIFTGDRTLELSRGQTIGLDDVPGGEPPLVLPARTFESAAPEEPAGPSLGAENLKSLIEALVSMRADARSASHWDLADQIRDALAAAGVEIRDEDEGTSWSFRESRRTRSHPRPLRDRS